MTRCSTPRAGTAAGHRRGARPVLAVGAVLVALWPAGEAFAERATYIYDDGGRLVEILRDDGLRSSYTYDEAGNPVVFDHVQEAPAATPDLAVQISASPDPARVSEVLTYRVRVRNHGLGDAALAELSLTLDPALGLLSAEPSQGSCALGTPLACDLGDLGAGAEATVTVQALAPATAGTVASTASASAANGDLGLVDNDRTLVTEVSDGRSSLVADLSATVTDSPDPALVGTPIDYLITVTNAGPSPALSVQVDITPPAGLPVLWITPSQGACGGVGASACGLGTLLAGASATVSVQVESGGTEPAVLAAQVDAASYDPAPADNAASATTEIDAGVVALEVGVTDPGQYGWNYGSSQHQVELVATFESTGEDLELVVVGFDIDQADEVALYHEGNLLGHLLVGPNGGHNSGDTFVIEAASQVPGTNELRFVQLTPGWTWGVKELRVDPWAPSPQGDVVLEVGVTDPGAYGWNYGPAQHPEELVAVFEGTDEDLVLTVVGYDIDLADEVSVHFNGVLLGHLTVGPNNGHNRGDSFVLDAASQIPGYNELRFAVHTVGWKWGVTELRLDPRAPTAHGDVVLAVGTLDPGAYGYNYGTGNFKEEMIASFVTDGSAPLELTLRGYDIDYGDEVSVYLNGRRIGYLSAGPNNGLGAPETLALPAADLVDGINHVRFMQRVAGWKWGVTELMVTVP